MKIALMPNLSKQNAHTYTVRIIKRLLELQWWNWPVEKIRANLPRIMRGEIDKLV